MGDCNGSLTNHHHDLVLHKNTSRAHHHTTYFHCGTFDLLTDGNYYSGYITGIIENTCCQFSQAFCLPWFICTLYVYRADDLAVCVFYIDCLWINLFVKQCSLEWWSCHTHTVHDWHFVARIHLKALNWQVALGTKLGHASLYSTVISSTRDNNTFFLYIW